ncbi:hypothetical protein E2C01_025034 [Portunus trituberculatus]|uniref:Uncharacterized protein n=1 Tax=Portunus trituberculatus TaxID=210409 RepID=A0A5B7EEG0_PORTR|nr:hypothetical protein [Portunus trituberculatus]
MDKEELISRTLRLKQEVMENKSTIQSLSLQRDWIIEKKAQVMDILEFIETISDARDADTRRTTRTIDSTSANASWIDKSWAKVCSSPERWKQWWESDNTKRLPPSRLGLTPPTHTTATDTSSTVAVVTISSDSHTPANNSSTASSASSTSSTVSTSTSCLHHSTTTWQQLKILQTCQVNGGNNQNQNLTWAEARERHTVGLHLPAKMLPDLNHTTALPHPRAEESVNIACVQDIQGNSASHEQQTSDRKPS